MKKVSKLGLFFIVFGICFADSINLIPTIIFMCTGIVFVLFGLLTGEQRGNGYKR